MNNRGMVISEIIIAFMWTTVLIAKYKLNIIQKHNSYSEHSGTMIRERYSLEKIQSEDQRISKELEEYIDKQQSELVSKLCAQITKTTISIAVYALSALFKALQRNRAQARNEALRNRLDNEARVEEVEEARVEEAEEARVEVEEGEEEVGRVRLGVREREREREEIRGRGGR